MIAGESGTPVFKDADQPAFLYVALHLVFGHIGEADTIEDLARDGDSPAQIARARMQSFGPSERYGSEDRA